MYHLKRRILIIISCAVCAGLVGCGGADDRLAELAPGLDLDTAALLTHPDQPAFARFTTTVSGDHLLQVRDALQTARYGEAPLGESDRVLLDQALDAVDGVLAYELGLDEYQVESADLAARPVAEVVRLFSRRRHLLEIFEDTARDPAAKVTAMETLQAAMLEAGDVGGELQGWDALAVVHHCQDQWDVARQLHRRGWEAGRHHGRLREQCRSWSQLMMYAMRRGWTAAERDTLLELVDQARRARLARTASMLISLQAYDAANQVRYSTARALFEDSIAVCRELGEPIRALPAYDLLLRMYASMECWNQVDKHLVMAEQLRTESEEEPGSAGRKELGRIRHDILAARSLAARGRADEAHAVFARAFDASTKPAFAEVGYYGQQWIEAMIANDRSDLAAEAIGVVAVHARIHGNRHIRLRLPFWRAWLAWREGDRTAALAQLDTFAADGLAHDRMTRDNLRFRYAALRACVVGSDDVDAAARILVEGWSDLFERVHGGEPGPEAYLDLGRNSHLRLAAHELVGDDPTSGYGLELLWRRTFLPRWPVPADPADLDMAMAARRLTVQAQARLVERDAIHCLYQVQRNQVIRWTADGHHVECSVLAASSAALRARVIDVLERMGTDPGTADAPVPPELAAELAELARAVLPERMFTPGTRPGTLLVSGESFLAQVPFSPLNLAGPGEYLPLGEVMDVAWLRCGLGGGTADATVPVVCTTLIVASPTLDRATRRRFQLTARLPGAETEASAVMGIMPSTTLIRADAATPERVKAEWDGADVLYFLGHAVRDAEVPMATWLPLAPASLSDVYPGLGLKDVVSACFDRCRLVVLSGCGTGAPYVDGLSSSPSLGDAFLDAGAAAVIQTFWRVRDEGALFRPERILESWQQEEESLVAAVAEERRRCISGPDGYRHPFSWAAWTIKTSGY